MNAAAQIILCLASVGIAVAGMAWYYERQIDQAHDQVVKARSELFDLMLYLCRFPGNPRSWSQVQREQHKYLVEQVEKFLVGSEVLDIESIPRGSSMPCTFVEDPVLFWFCTLHHGHSESNEIDCSMSPRRVAQ
jgi:hypothetical protein